MPNPPTLPSLTGSLLRHTAGGAGVDGHYATELASLRLFRADAASRIEHQVYTSAICVVVQGAKQVLVGDTTVSYATGDCVVIGVDVPVVSEVTQARADAPYLAVVLDLDTALLSDIAREAGVTAPADTEDSTFGLFHVSLGQRARGALARLLDLLDAPGAATVLSRSIVRELYYWLLVGPSGPALARLASPGGYVARVAASIGYMRAAFPGTVRLEELAGAASMSPSSFRTHFKATTDLAPIQYYKRLKLLEARRLLTSGAGDNARGVAYRVGYESPSQFSREYARAFGVPPGRDRARSVRGAGG